MLTMFITMKPAMSSLPGSCRAIHAPSGATMTAINATTAKEVGVEATGYPIILSTANGRVAAKRANVKLLTIGPHKIENHPVVVSESFGDVNLLGMNFLNNMESWRVEGNVMILQP